MPAAVTTLPEVVAHHARERAEAPAFTFVSFVGSSTEELHFGELERRARGIAAVLGERGYTGEPVLLLLPAGSDYVCSLLGCFLAGAVAVPAYPPGRSSLRRATQRIESVIADAGVRCALTTPAIAAMLAHSGTLANVAIVTPADALGVPTEMPRAPDPRSPALLQYTSGSTASPKGVVISHAALLANEQLARAAADGACAGNWVSWLPPYHDMGLIGAILHPLFLGTHAVMMTTEAFARRPLRWLQAISQWQATTTIAPNFAYDLCVQRVPPADRAGLDLSSLRVAWNGAEPINAETLERFANAYGPHGFRREAFYPCYGMAEATLIISGGDPHAAPVVRDYVASELEQDRAAQVSAPDAPDPRAPSETQPARAKTRRLVGCGKALPGERVLIVEPTSRRRLPPDRVGEVWVQSPSVADGYWKREAETAATFRAFTDAGEGPFLRTGDLGFLDPDGELFITGRLKDLIILRGLNHYPHDIERTVQGVHEALVADTGAAFAVDADGEERLVVVQELDKRVGADIGALLAAIPEAIREEHGAAVESVVLIKRGSLAKTSSGKVQRRETRRAFLAGELRVTARWPASGGAAPEGCRATHAVRVEPPLVATRGIAQPHRRGADRPELPAPLTSAGRQRRSTPAILPPPPTAGMGAHAPSAPEPAAAPHARERTPARRDTRTRPVPAAILTEERRIADFLCAWLAEKTGTATESIDPHAPLARYGVDSLVATELAEELERFLGVELDSTVSYDYPSVASLARQLARRDADDAAPRFEPAAASRTATPQRGAAAEPIAIVGMACRFPGAASLAAFWNNLRHGVHSITEVPADRWDADALYDPRPGTPGKSRSRWGGFVEDVDRFDAAFFGIGAAEAQAMDPQQRMFLETAWEALEDAGVAPTSLGGTDAGVFAAVCSADYASLYGGALELVGPDFGTGSSPAVVANRVSHVLGLHGPSEVVDSACSSSLVALRHACASLAQRESALAIVGGVNAVLTPEPGIYFSHVGALSSDDRVKTFDADADGFIRSEGAGVVVLKRLSDAVAAGDRIYAVVAGSSVNHVGRSNGLTAPNGLAQRAVVGRAMTAADITPDDLDYVEAHGVGTPVADAVELTSLGAVLSSRSREEPVLVGSAKPNVGHLEAASGMVSLIKTALALHHEEIPPHLHLREPHPDIGLEALPLAIPTAPVPWRRGARPRFAGISCFGFGGANAHVVLREAPQTPPSWSDSERPLHVLTLSAQSPSALRTSVKRHVAALRTQPLADAAHTANVGRTHLTHRVAVVAEHTSEARSTLAQLARGERAAGVHTGVVAAGHRASLGLVLPEQGLAPGLARELFDTHPGVRQTLTLCDRLLQGELQRPLLALLCSDNAALAPLLARPCHAHAVQLALQHALCELLARWGLAPDVVLGQGTGELSAALAVGAVELEGALRLAVLRGRVLASLQPGAPVVATVREYRLALERLAFRPTNAPLIAGSRGRRLGPGTTLDPAHWRDHLYHESRSDDGIAALADEGCNAVLVVGATAHASPLGPAAPTVTCTGYDWSSLLGAVGELHCAGAELDWRAFDAPYPRRKVSLPTYPFERERYWMDFPSRDLSPEPIVVERPSSHPLISRIRTTVPKSGFIRTRGARAQGDGEA